MRRWTGLGLAVALVVGGCATPRSPASSSVPRPATPGPAATPAAVRSPLAGGALAAEVDRAQATWEARRPAEYAYTATASISGMSNASWRVTGMDGHVEAQPIATDPWLGGQPMRDHTVEGMFDAARAALGGDGLVELRVDPAYGYLASLDITIPNAADASSADSVTDFTTPTTGGAAPGPRQQLDWLEADWRALASPAWEYTWTRFSAADAGAAPAWLVHHEDGRTITTGVGSAAGSPPPPEVDIARSVALARSALDAGGWVDVGRDLSAGLDALIAIDPSSATAGDASWVRIEFTDIDAVATRARLDAARERWAGAGLTRYSYTWRFRGPRAAYGYTVSMDGDLARIRATGPAPMGEQAQVAPRIADLFDAIGQTLSSGRSVFVTFDPRLGYPTKVVVPGVPELLPSGTITITDLRQR